MIGLFTRVRLWLRSILMRGRLEREMQDEMRAHLESSTARLIARGLSPAAARREAFREFGNVGYLEERARDARGGVWVDALGADSRFALRSFAKHPVTTLTMFVVLLGGMTISTLLFAVVHSYAERPPTGMTLQPDVVRIRGSETAGVDGRRTRTFSEEELGAYRALTDHFQTVAGWSDAFLLGDAGGNAERRLVELRVSFVSDGYFSVMGIEPVMGPGLPVGVATAAPVAVIGYDAWDRLFGRASDVIGSTLTINGVSVVVVGVAPARFVGVNPTSRPQLWMPLAARPLLLPTTPGDFRVVARLRPDVELGAAAAAVKVVAERTVEHTPELRTREAATEVVPLLSANGDPMFERDVGLLSFAVGLLAVLVLLVTCTNVSSLLTGLATARRHEIAIRLSLGAARARVVRQLLTESALLACAAAGGALLVVWTVLRVTPRLIPVLPFEIDVTVPTALVTFGTALAVGILFGISPALHATRLAIAGALRDSTATIAATRARLQRALVVAQIAFTQPLIVMLAAVMIWLVGAMQPTRRTELGDHVVRISLRSTDGGLSQEEFEQRLSSSLTRLHERLQSTPGVQAVAVDWVFRSELGAYASHADDRVPDAAREVVRLAHERASRGYLSVLGMPLLRGRELEPTDPYDVDAPNGEVPVIVGDELARVLWPEVDPIGRRLVREGDTTTVATLVVVGVVHDPLVERFGTGRDQRVFLPPLGNQSSMDLLIRTVGPAAPMLPAITAVVRDEASPGLIGMSRTLAEIEETTRGHFRMVTGGLIAAGLVALLLSAIGLYAVVSFAVGQRTREIAVRIAIGAHAARIGRWFLLDGLRLSGYGLAFGLPMSLLGLRMLMTIPDVPRVSLPWVMTVAALGVALVATAATWFPARRAASVDPAITLRSE